MNTAQRQHDVVIIGGGSAGISMAASLHRRRHGLDIAIIEPSERHCYQPGWTMVGGGIFSLAETIKPMKSVMPEHVTWYRAEARAFQPDEDRVELSDGTILGYQRLVVAPGLELNWDAVEGLSETLGTNGVTSNYHPDTAPYTWQLIQNLKSGTALFSQPPMPIKCAGAPQKAMYLACDYWMRQGVLGSMDVHFKNAGGVMFGVPDYVPALERYVERYHIHKDFQQNLVAVNGPAKKATFRDLSVEGEERFIECRFDMLHAVPPQRAPEFVRESVLANEAGWLDLDSETLQHPRYPKIFGLGDVSGTANAKTAAAVRKQVPVVAENLLASLDNQPLMAAYYGYGSCPLTVERGRIVLAEFGYGGQLQPTFPKWVNDGTQPTRLAWMLKARYLPYIYWHGMLKGHEWLVKPGRRNAA